MKLRSRVHEYNSTKYRIFFFFLYLLTNILIITFTPVFAAHQSKLLDASFRWHDNPERIILLTGHAKWNYYAMGKEFCERVNRKQKFIVCHAIASKGSAWNLQQLQSGRYQLAFAQSDITYQFLKAQPKTHNIKILAKISPQYYYVLVRMNDAIYSFNDLFGKVINLGPKGSGLHATNEIVFRSLGFLKQRSGKSFFKQILHYPAPQEAALLCSHRVDAITFILEGDDKGYTPRLKNIMQTCPMRIMSLTDSEVAKLKNLHLSYQNATIIPLTGIKKPLQTISLRMLLVGNPQDHKPMIIMKLYSEGSLGFRPH